MVKVKGRWAPDMDVELYTNVEFTEPKPVCPDGHEDIELVSKKFNTWKCNVCKQWWRVELSDENKLGGN